jgi:hypothetical protein
MKNMHYEQMHYKKINSNEVRVIEKTGFVDQRKSEIESFLSSSLMYQQQNNAAPVSLLIFS